jgi:peptide/nickel transport system substrate-binding protein
MKRKLLFSFLIFMLVTLPLLAGCKGTGTTPTPTGPAVGGDWWDKWGEPQYGGTLVTRAGMIDTITSPDDARACRLAAWFEVLFCDDLTLDRDIYPFTLQFTPTKYLQGWLAESWEQTDPQTWTIHIRKGVHWLDNPPTYGREFTAHDVQYTYDRVLAVGEFAGAEPSVFYAPLIPSIAQVIATDDYTVQFKLNTPSASSVWEVTGPQIPIPPVPREWVALTEEEKAEWQNCIGTGPFIVTDFVPNTSMTFSRNPNYWGYDVRYPQNKLPYLDAVKVLVVPDISTSLAALRTGKLDIIHDQRDYPSLSQAASLAETNPDIQQFHWPAAAQGVFFKYNTEPFTDIRVRQAMQLAIDIKTIAQTHYQGTVDGIPAGLLSPLAGEEWAVPYDQWPKDLREEYSYDPDRARELLAEAGYPNGFSTNVYASTADDMALLQILKAQFMDIGVDMEINSMDMMQMRPFIMDGLYDQMIYGGMLGMTDCPAYAAGVFWSKKFERIGGDVGGVIDPDYDVLAEKFYAATTEAEAQQAFQELDRYALEQHWIAHVCPYVSTQVCQPWVKGWSGENLRGSWGWVYIRQMWIDQDLKQSMGY